MHIFTPQNHPKPLMETTRKIKPVIFAMFSDEEEELLASITIELPEKGVSTNFKMVIQKQGIRSGDYFPFKKIDFATQKEISSYINENFKIYLTK